MFEGKTYCSWKLIKYSNSKENPTNKEKCLVEYLTLLLIKEALVIPYYSYLCTDEKKRSNH